MRTFSPRIVCMLGLLFVLSESSDAQLRRDPEGRSDHFGARSGAFAGAYVSESYDVSSMYWNPASISHIQRRSILWNYLQEWDGKAKTEMISFPLSSGYSTSLSAGVYTGQVSVANRNGGSTIGAYYGAAGAIGYKLAPAFSAGILGSLKYHTLFGRTGWTSAAMLGLMYVPSPEISYGLVYSGFGEIAEYRFIDSAAVIVRSPVPQRLSLGLSLRYPSSRSERIVSIVLANDKVFGQEGIRYNGAIEWTLFRMLDLRTGYVVSPTYAGAKYGLGARSGGLQIDYTLSPGRSTNRFHEFTFSLIL